MHIVRTIAKKLTPKQIEQREIDRLKQIVLDEEENDESLMDSLERVMNKGVTRYRGIPIILNDGRYHFLRSSTETLEEARQIIDSAYLSLGKK